MTEALIKMRNIGVCYRSRQLFGGGTENWALQDLSLDLHRGDTLGVIGRNGVGKSTLLKLLADIIEPDRGEMQRADVRSTLLSLRVGFLNHLDARQNTVMAGMLLGLSRKAIENKVDEILDYAELNEKDNVPIGTYSTGTVARLGFAIAMQIDPEIMLIDEMLAVGDAGFRQKSAQAIRQRMQSDKTVVLVAHNENVIRELCNKVIWIHEGRSIASGPADEILEQYQEFIKQQNRAAA